MRAALQTKTIYLMMKLLNNMREDGRALAALLGALFVCGSIVGLTFFFASAIDTTGTQPAAAAVAVDSFAGIELTAGSALVYDAYTNKILFAKNAQTPLPLASVTKLMLAAVVAEVLPMDSIVTITPQAIAQDGDSGFTEGERWNALDLIDLTLIESSNDGAEALAEAAGPSIRAKYPTAPSGDTAATVWRMNQKAKELDMTQTYYLDSNGLDASTSMAGAYGSAYDMSVLFTYMIANDLNIISATTESETVFTSLQGNAHTARTTNESLGDIPGLIAGKTGFTDLAGGNLVVAFDASIGHPVIVVVLSSTHEGRFNDVQQLVTAARRAITGL